MRRLFGTDGVRGIVGGSLTPELVQSLGKAAALWSDGGRVFVGRDTRGSGPELEAAFARGVVEAGGTAVLAGVVPTPAVALLALDLGAVISASHNPPEYNGVKLFDGNGRKLTDAQEEEIEALVGAEGPGGGSILPVDVAVDSYLDHVLERFETDLSGRKLAVDCANGAYSGLAPRAFRNLGAEVVSVGDAPDGTNINVGCGATDLALLQRTVVEQGCDLGIAFDGDGDRMLAVDEHGKAVDGDQIISILALGIPGIATVAVTVMTNLGFHRLMAEHGIRVVTTDVGDRYVLEALRREEAVLGGEQSGHVIYLVGHDTGDGLVAALLLLACLDGGSLAEAAAAMPVYPQAKQNVRLATRELPQAVVDEAKRLNEELAGRGRVLVRPSGTEPVVRVLGEAETAEEAERLCASIAALVTRELG